jgi:hypothetical protein
MPCFLWRVDLRAMRIGGGDGGARAKVRREREGAAGDALEAVGGQRSAVSGQRNRDSIPFWKKTRSPGGTRNRTATVTVP